MTAPASQPQLYLASASPRRRELLAAVGLRFARVAADVDEDVLPGEAPDRYVRRLALAKARAGRQTLEAADATPPVLGADTAVVIDEAILGKPTGRDDALAMLARLSGREHRVLTAVALVRGAREACALSVSRVRFRELDEGERRAYWDTGEPADKAGAYGVQGIGASFVRELHGSHSGVMGLPLYETAALLRAFGVELLSARRAPVEPKR